MKILKRICIFLITIGFFASASAAVYYYIQYNNEIDNVQQVYSLIADAGISVDDLASGDEFSINLFKEIVAEANVSIEVIQKFFPDQIVYKHDGEIIYADIDTSLALNSYDFSAITDSGGFKEYEEDGIYAKKGIDVSKYQEDIDWEAVAEAGIDFAIIRLGYRGYSTGELNLDEYFLQNIEGATNAGIDVGVYFFSQATTIEEALEEYQFCIENIGDYELTYPIVFDMEDLYEDEYRTMYLTTEERTEITIAFCEAAVGDGYTPMIYGNISWMMESLDLTQLEGYEKWFAQYFDQPFFPYDLSMWQYTQTGIVDGIEGYVDLNICFKEYN